MAAFIARARCILSRPSHHTASSFVRHSSSRSAGLVGLANVGKSTLFNALVRAQKAQAANYPFCTIEPNVALVEVPDERLDTLARLLQSEKTTRFQVECHDIAGLIAGASKGEGLGNAFLANIRAVHVIVQVVRCFEDPDIIHVMNHPDPARDVGVIENELVLADLQSVEKRLASAKGKAARTPEGQVAAQLLEKVRGLLEEGLPAHLLDSTIETSARPVWKGLQLLTQKPTMYVCNVAEDDAAKGNTMTQAVIDTVRARHAEFSKRTGLPPPSADEIKDMIVIACAKLEAEAALLQDDERAEFLSAYGLTRTGTDSILQQTARLLKLQTFYTSGPTESRAWSIPVGATAVQAAGEIHTDFAKGFIKAEVTSYADYLQHGGEKAAREAAKTRAEGKDYVMQDGDVVLFRFNVSR